MKKHFIIKYILNLRRNHSSTDWAISEKMFLELARKTIIYSEPKPLVY